MESTFNSITSVINKILTVIMSALPTSPFDKILSKLDELPYLQYINWFIPFDLICDITLVWLTAVGLYYLYMIILRWIKAID